MRATLLICAVMAYFSVAPAWAADKTPSPAERLEAKGDRALYAGDTALARGRYGLALRRFRNTDDLESIARLFVKTGKIAMLEKNTQQAFDYFAQARELARRENLARTEADALLAEAGLALDMQETARAHAALDAATQLGADGWKPLNTLGRLQMAAGDLATAESTLAEALEQSDDADEANAASSCRINLALLAMKRGDNGRALEHLKQALELDKKEGTAIAIGETLHLIGMAYEAEKDFPTAHYFYSRAYGVNSTTSLQYRAEADKAAMERNMERMRQAGPLEKPSP